MRRIKTKEIPAVTAALNKKGGYRCPLCKESLRAAAKKSPVLDHDHQSGAIRDVLCRNCNGMEGKVFNLARRSKAGLTEREWISNLLRYLDTHSVNQTGLIHPTHKTEEEKRLARNKKARLRRAKLKASK